MIAHIQNLLTELEHEENIKVLFAAESGSRAWGFESPDSDWDVRFIYVRTVDSYLGIKQPRDVIEKMLPNDIDLAGWDLPKALRLFAKSNPALTEWLYSPIVYQKDEEFYCELLRLKPQYVGLRAGLHHYRNMAQTAYDKYLTGDMVKYKKYLYAIRPLLAAKVILRDRTWPPTRFDEVRTLSDESAEFNAALDTLLDLKRASGEKQVHPPIGILNEWIVATLQSLDTTELPQPDEIDWQTLDVLLKRTITAHDRPNN